MKKVCLITPGHISTNPRLVKEAKALSQAGLQVNIIFTQYVKYLVAYDEQILLQHPQWEYNCIDWTGRNFASKINRIISGISNKIMRLAGIRLLTIKSASKLLNRNLNRQIKQAITTKADLYIAHNLGALPVAITAAKANKSKSGFDAEDYHRNESSNDPTDFNVKVKTLIEDTFIPRLNYMTAASPLISVQYAQLYNITVATVLNAFPKINTLTASLKQPSTPLKLFWFSQTIGPNRGIEIIIEAMGMANADTELTLLGEVSEDYKKELPAFAITKGLADANIKFHSPVAPDKVFNLAVNYDIGLATESNYPLNRDICLTNKIFTYIQCGLAVIASNTTAQTALVKQYPQVGKLYKNHDPQSLADIINFYAANKRDLQLTCESNFVLGQDVLNWENESLKFIAEVNGVLNISDDQSTGGK